MPYKFLKQNEGVTLVELAVVMLIISITCAMAIPDLKKAYFKRNLQTAALELQQVIRSVGQDCLRLESNKYYISLNSSNDSYAIYDIANQSKPVKRIKMPSGVDLISSNFNQQKIQFTIRGYPNTGGKITLKGISGDFKYVIITPVTGRTRVSDDDSSN